MQQLMHSFVGHSPPAEILAAVRCGEISSFCLFAGQNIDHPAQLRELNEALLRAADKGGYPPPLIAIDQEGGQLVAIANRATELPGNMALGATRSPDLAEQAGRVLGRELRAMGVNLNFAPSLDVNANPANPVVGVRSFGADPALVADLGTAMIQGMQAEGVYATAKHFPGHGDISVDTHYASPVVSHPLEHIQAIELAPFRAAIQAGVRAVMSAHIVFTALDPEYPATLSRAVLDGHLRQKMEFDGVIITDAMDMQPVARYGPVDSVRMALQAGADLVLLAHLSDQLELSRQVRHPTRQDALLRIQTMRQGVPDTLPSLEVVGCTEHQLVAQTIADRSITLVRDNNHQLPLRPAADDTIAVVTSQPVNLTPADTSSGVTIVLADAIRQRHPRTKALELPRSTSTDDIASILHATESADIIVVGTIQAENDPAQAELVHAFHARNQHPIVVALRTPYDLVAFPMIETYLCAYGIRSVAMHAVARVLFGEIEARGILPCPIPDISLERPSLFN